MKVTKKKFQKGPKGPQAARLPTFNWAKIRVEYLTSDFTQQQIATKFGCSLWELQRHIYRDSWQLERERWRRENAEAALESAREDVLKKHAEAIRLVYVVKTQVAQRLLARLRAEEYDPTPRDLEVLQRLELDLLGVGTKSAAAINLNVTVEQRIETVLSQIAGDREEALKVVDVIAERGDETGGGRNPELAKLLYGGDVAGDDEPDPEGG